MDQNVQINKYSMKELVILMSTYNGERYLKEQLDSILNQQGVKIKLLIRDDGSTDRTLKILEDYKSCHQNIFEIINGENIGWKKSFMFLIDYAADNYSCHSYFALSDQDDIWLPDKLITAVDAIKQSYPTPLMYCSNLYYYKNNKIHGLVKDFKLMPSPKNCLVKNIAAGCTIVFNQELLKALAHKKARIEIAHDYWIYMVANFCGKVIIDKSAHILYRQHDNNQIGSKHGFKEIWARRLKTLRDIRRTIRPREIAAKELLRIYGSSIQPDSIKSIEKVANYRNSFLRRLCIIFDNGYSMGKWSNNFWLKMHMVFGTL